MFWRATCYTFSHPARKTTLKRILYEFSEGADLIEPKSRAISWEQRQVSASDSRGLGFGWVEISRGEKHGVRIQPESRVAVWNLYAYEENNTRLGYAEFLGKASAYGKDKHTRLSVGGIVKSFWEWLTH